MLLHKKIGEWLVDYGYALRGAITTIIYRNPPPNYRNHSVAGKAPVILIPGILNKWGFMKDLGDQISLQGHPIYIIPELGYNLHGIPASAEILRSFIEKENLSDAILVAHSKGGLIGKYMLAHHNADNRVSGMVAIATPFSGSTIASLIPYDSFRELRADSEVIKDLEKQRAVNEKIICIAPEDDEVVVPERSSFLDGAAENIQVPVNGHHKVLFSGVVLQVILGSIEKFQKKDDRFPEALPGAMI